GRPDLTEVRRGRAVGQAVQLNGTTSTVAMPFRGVLSMDSFTVTAWANLTAKGDYRTVAAQDGTQTTPFALMYDKVSDRWAMIARTDDTTTAGNSPFA